MAANKALKNLRDFFKDSEIQPFAENLDHDEFSVTDLSFMSVIELQQVCFFPTVFILTVL